MRRATVALTARLMEWTDEEAEKFLGYYRQHGATLADSVGAAGYTLSLWYYQDERIYEVNIDYKGLDFTDPAVQRQRQSVTGYIPMHQLARKLREWLNQYGHLVMGSHNPRKVDLYKRLFARQLPGKIVDMEGDVPGGGNYFFVIGWDKDVVSRLRLEAPAEPEAAAV